MSWVFINGATKVEVIDHIIRNTIDKTLRHILQGGNLWTIKQGAVRPYIVCFRLGQEGNQWGFTDLAEGCNPPCNCPLELLDLTPVVNKAWRESVRAYHARHNPKPVVGEVWSLRNQDIPQVTIEKVTPHIVGSYNGSTRRIKPAQLHARAAFRRM